MTKSGSIARGLGIATTMFFAVGMTAACGGSASVPPAATATTPGPDDEAEGLMEHHRYHHHGGVTLFIAMSLETLGISPEQRPSVEKIRHDLHDRMEPARAAEQQLATTLADGLARGTIDAAIVDAAVAKVAASAVAVEGGSAYALNGLHAVLTPPQRAALVDKVEAHWAVWQTANSDGSAPGAEAGGTHLAVLARDLDLTADQVERIRAAVNKGGTSVPPLDAREIVARLRAFGDAFRNETFDALAITIARDASAHMTSWGAAHLARFVEAATPILTPDQRASLAERLREHAAHDPSAQANQ